MVSFSESLKLKLTTLLVLIVPATKPARCLKYQTPPASFNLCVLGAAIKKNYNHCNADDKTQLE